ncbi:Abi family protein [Sulfuricurvum sp.]|uniref:Abi family protein n=1 Tax=Sulfuricurvum sp. TaxID=2025608 RepID=UPI0019B51CE9|nr:Abi family protein [Sulfuricurvum sp.]MBD3798662.1 Abi family protein [Campylobacterota bacterium]MBD3805949.1 Abi family protein [Sulfuricurvum sp.]
MDLRTEIMRELRQKLKINTANPDYKKIEEAIGVLNVAYLKVAANEIYGMLNHCVKIRSKYALLLSVYNKNIREHQVMFLLFSIFENAMRSKAAITLSTSYSSRHSDDWWKDISSMNKDMIKPIGEALIKLHKNIPNINTYDIFDTFTLGHLQSIYTNHWSLFQHFFTRKIYKGHSLPTIDRENFKTKFENIRDARNDISHHKPINYSRRGRSDLIKDCEVLLSNLDFNLEAAVNGIDPNHQIIRLQYV